MSAPSLHRESTDPALGNAIYSRLYCAWAGRHGPWRIYVEKKNLWNKYRNYVEMRCAINHKNKNYQGSQSYIYVTLPTCSGKGLRMIVIVSLIVYTAMIFRILHSYIAIHSDFCTCDTQCWYLIHNSTMKLQTTVMHVMKTQEQLSNHSQEDCIYNT